MLERALPELSRDQTLAQLLRYTTQDQHQTPADLMESIPRRIPKHLSPTNLSHKAVGSTALLSSLPRYRACKDCSHTAPTDIRCDVAGNFPLEAAEDWPAQ